MASNPTPPDSTRGSGETKLERCGEYADTMDPQRIGAPGPLMFLPLQSLELSSLQITPHINFNTTILPVVKNKIRDGNLVDQHIVFVDRTPWRGALPTPNFTILIVAECSPNWLQVLDENRHFLVSIGVGQIKVEIITQARRALPKVFPAKDLSFRQVWENTLKAETLHILKNSNWSAIDIVRMGPSHQQEENPLTLSLTVAASEFGQEWYNRMAELKAMLT